MILLLSFLVTLFNELSEEPIEQIVEVINLAYQKQPFNRMDKVRITISQIKEILADPANQLFLLYSEDKICGTVLLNQSEISLFAVHPDFQGRGYGRQLLAAAEEEAFLNSDFVQLKVIPLFQEQLIAYYETMGYVLCGSEALAVGKLDRIQEEYHDQVYALVLRKNRSF